MINVRFLFLSKFNAISSRRPRCMHDVLPHFQGKVFFLQETEKEKKKMKNWSSSLVIPLHMLFTTREREIFHDIKRGKWTLCVWKNHKHSQQPTAENNSSRL